MELNWKEILSSKIGNFYLISSRERDIDIFKHLIPNNSEKVIARVIRGERCRTKESLFKEFTSVLEFPNYFGHNWDAFDECINDMSWLPANNYVLVISNFDKLLSESPEDLHIFLDIIKDTIFQWNKNNIKPFTPFNILLQCETENEEKCKTILKKENIHPALKILKPFKDIK